MNTTHNNTPIAAPIAMFVYNRLSVTKKTIEHLQKNELAPMTPLYIFSDGGKDEKSCGKVNELRRYLHTITGFREVHIIERAENFYLEKNVTEGIRSVLTQYDRIIVLEDDVCTSPCFLKYMNEALEKYANIPKVMHVAGFTNLDIPQRGDTYFTRHMAGCGAWATWKDRWQYFTHYTSRDEALNGMSKENMERIEYGGAFRCLRFLDRKPIPWDICWEVAIYKRNGLCLSPTHTLIKNIGLRQGTHFSNWQRLFGWYEWDRPFRIKPMKLEDIPVCEDPEIEAMNAAALKDYGMRYNLLGKVVRYVYLKIKKHLNVKRNEA